MKYLNIFLSFYFIFLISCTASNEETAKDPFSHIKDEDVKTLLSKAIKAAGGLDAWRNKKELRFKKYFALYDSLGNTENAVDQVHHYTYQPQEDIEINWEKDNDQHQIHYTNGKVIKQVNGTVDENANLTSLTNSVMSATFVLSIPFNFLDPGAEMSHDGKTVLEDGEKVEVLKIQYQPDKYDNLTTADIWWVYFDESNYKLLAYMVQHADHFSYVKNLSFTKVDGFTFPKERKSWRVKPDRSELYLRADYIYSDYQVE